MSASGQWFIVRYRFSPIDERRIELGLAPVGGPVKPVCRWFFDEP